MLVLISVVHVIVALGLVVFVLLQDPKGGAMGIFGGGTSNSLFGATGAGNFLTTLTKWLAVIFAASCLLLTYLTSKKNTSILDNFTPPPANNAVAPPTTPEQKTDATTAPQTPPAAEGSAPAETTPTTPAPEAGDKK